MAKIIVVGNGLAGLSAAITAADLGAKVTLISQNPPERSQSVMAAGGINAALNTKGEGDSQQQHYEDTLKSGCGLADSEAVQNMTKAAPEIIKTLSCLGVIFSRDDNGNINLRYFGGQKKMRTAFSNSGIGKQLMCGLSQETRKLSVKGSITVKENYKFLSLIIDEGVCLGGVFADNITGKLTAITGDALILATGGMNGIFGDTTGSLLSDGSGTAAVFRQGAKLGNGEMIQYHPTTVKINGKRMLISEAARGEGGRLFTYKENKKWYFMEDWYPEEGNLAPRDIVSKCIYRVCNDLKLGISGDNQVYLDITFLPKDKIETKLKEIWELCRTYLKIDPSKEYIPVYPGIHYFMGGIYVDKEHQSSIEGLFAAGECACQYHGANRLGGNSTLGAIYGGTVAATSAVNKANLAEKNSDALINAEKTKSRLLCAENEIIKREAQMAKYKAGNIPPSVILRELRIIMNSTMGIERNEIQIFNGLRNLNVLAAKAENMGAGELTETEPVIVENMLYAAKALLLSAIERKETRGAHIRKDYPERDDNHYRKTTVASYFDDGTIDIAFKEVH
ncbi:FAD-binding protein [Aminipila sp.]|uniref:FAD-binding protein n=1 Tax=Aminipila sp. TaxID=2060095 RepID=UPI00289AC33A|nr:FAD-binding protein [Aminipila sp.]